MKTITFLLLLSLTLTVSNTSFAEQIDPREQKVYILFMDIQPGWSMTREGNSIHVKGRIKNSGERIVKSFKVTAKFYNQSRDVVDSASQIVFNKLSPNEQKSFDITAPDQDDISSATPDIESVSLQ